MNILITQLGSMGDCLLTTAIARQINEVDYPGCRLTWLIGDLFKSTLDNNPHIDEIIEIKISYDNTSITAERDRIDAHIEKLAQTGHVFDKVFVFDINETNKPSRYCYGTLRSMYFRIYQELYGHRMTVSPKPVLCLHDSEVANVKAFVEKHHLSDDGCYPILVECGAKSRQSPLDSKMALQLCHRLVKRFSQVRCILSQKEKIATGNMRIVDGSKLTFRENAELLNHCKLLVGGNSGITWLNASTWSNKIPMVQNVFDTNENSIISYSVEMDCKNLGVSTDNLIEFQDADRKTLFQCVSSIVTNSFAETKKLYRERDVSPIEYYAKCYSFKKFGFDPWRDIAITAKTKVYLFGFLPILKIKTSRFR